MVQARTGLVTGICGGRSYYGWFSLLEGVRGTGLMRVGERIARRQRIL